MSISRERTARLRSARAGDSGAAGRHVTALGPCLTGWRQSGMISVFAANDGSPRGTICGGKHHETDLPSTQPEAGQQARLPGAHGNQGWSQGDQRAAAQGPQADRRRGTQEVGRRRPDGRSARGGRCPSGPSSRRAHHRLRGDSDDLSSGEEEEDASP